MSSIVAVPPTRTIPHVRRRLDAELVRRGLAETRTQAQELVRVGRVLVAGTLADKSSRQVGPDESVAVVGPPKRFVGRGGEKLLGAIERFGLHFGGHRVLDAGASTGGFTDCALQHGAREVVALDVGYGQLDQRLRDDPRVVVMERTNLRHVDPAQLGPFDTVVADLSFISLRTVMGVLVGCVAPHGSLVVLVKPQFEAGRDEARRGRGVISDPQVWRDVLRSVAMSVDSEGAEVVGLAPSPLRGADGNVEFLLHARRRPPATMTGVAPADLEHLVESCLGEIEVTR